MRRATRLVFWPFIFLFISMDVFRELVFRLQMLFTCTAQWALGDKRAMEYVCDFLDAKVRKQKAELKRMGGD